MDTFFSLNNGLAFCAELITEHSFLKTVTKLKNLDLQSNLVKKALINKQHNLGTRGPFLESPGNLTGPKSCFEIKVSRNVGCVLASNEVHFDFLTDSFTVPFSKLLKLPSLWKTKQLNGPGNYQELRETGPRNRSCLSQKRGSVAFNRPIGYCTTGWKARETLRYSSQLDFVLLLFFVSHYLRQKSVNSSKVVLTVSEDVFPRHDQALLSKLAYLIFFRTKSVATRIKGSRKVKKKLNTPWHILSPTTSLSRQEERTTAWSFHIQPDPPRQRVSRSGYSYWHCNELPRKTTSEK